MLNQTGKPVLENGLIKSAADLYYLKKEDIAVLDRLGEKSAQNIVDAIEKSKGAGLEKLLCGLGIRHIGEKAAQSLAAKFGNINAIMNASAEDLCRVDDIGKESAESVVSFFKGDHVKILIERLIDAGVSTESKEKPLGNALEGKTVVVTGTLPTLKRAEAEAKQAEAEAKLKEAEAKKAEIEADKERQDYYQQLAKDLAEDREDRKRQNDELRAERDHYKESRDNYRDLAEKFETETRKLRQAYEKEREQMNERMDQQDRKIARMGNQIAAMRPFQCGDLKCKKRVRVTIAECEEIEKTIRPESPVPYGTATADIEPSNEIVISPFEVVVSFIFFAP